MDLIIEPILFLWCIIFTFYYTRAGWDDHAWHGLQWHHVFETIVEDPRQQGKKERATLKGVHSQVMCFASHSKVVEFEIIFINHSFITSWSVMMSQIDWTACKKCSHIPLPPGLLVHNEALRPCQHGRSARLLVCSIHHTILGRCQPLVSKWSDQMGF